MIFRGKARPKWGPTRDWNRVGDRSDIFTRLTLCTQLDPTARRIVLMNRADGPDQVMDLGEQRVPNIDDDLEAALPLRERRAIADEDKGVAGCDPQSLSAGSRYRLDRNHAASN